MTNLFSVHIRQSGLKGSQTWIKQKFPLKQCDISTSAGMKTLCRAWSVYVKLSPARRRCSVWCAAEGLSHLTSCCFNGQNVWNPSKLCGQRWAHTSDDACHLRVILQEIWSGTRILGFSKMSLVEGFTAFSFFFKYGLKWKKHAVKLI